MDDKRLQRERKQIRAGWLPDEVVLYNRIEEQGEAAGMARVCGNRELAAKHYGLADRLCDDLIDSLESRGMPTTF